MSRCLCAHNVPLFSGLDMHSLELSIYQFVIRVLNEISGMLGDKPRHLKTTRPNVSAMLIVKGTRNEFVYCVGRRFTEVQDAEVVDHALSDYRKTSSS
jgi:hypothetical protein